ncbi:hypothetical protein PFICI_07013 [Pestalotiopsis fici W106-1]|uniref:Uncharacterized protein n=1 Tax=Pestalotiopsis fici (strain W106-1 / CGMCC3.15140) TaxID=1229662 RepID=W3XA09_PESFW|nr:uncharacterized protein PFICI_07013 [Pestalotiopsis fici W106-1]ETS82011.1 hypothetical protein PFICI_07013 [Pestalotiopsis fici W106-1]
MRRYEGLWHKRQLVPCWILQCLAAGVFLIASGLLLAAAAYVKKNETDLDYSYYGYSTDQLLTYAAAAGSVILVFSVCTIVFDIVECVLYARRVLSPVALLVLAVLKTAAWGAYFILAIVSAAQGSASWLDLFLSAVLVSTALSQLILGARFTHRLRKGTLDNRGNYSAAAAQHVEGGMAPPPAGYAYGGPQLNPFNDTSYRSPSPNSAVYPQKPEDPNYGVEMQSQRPPHYA